MQNPIGNEASIADREEAHHVLKNMKVLDLYNRVRRAPRSEPDAAGRQLRIGGNVAGMVRQLVYWENKGHAEDSWIWKSRSEWEDEAGLTYRMLRTARETAKAEGLLSFEERMHHDGRTRVFYRLDMLGVLRLLSGEDRLKRHGEDSNRHSHNPDDTDVTPPLTNCNPTPYKLSGVPLQVVTLQ